MIDFCLKISSSIFSEKIKGQETQCDHKILFQTFCSKNSLSVAPKLYMQNQRWGNGNKLPRLVPKIVGPSKWSFLNMRGDNFGKDKCDTASCSKMFPFSPPPSTMHPPSSIILAYNAKKKLQIFEDYISCKLFFNIFP